MFSIGASFGPTLGLISTEGLDVRTAILYGWTLCGGLIIILSIMIGVWLYKDARQHGRGAAGWAVVGAIPIVGLAAWLVYLMTEGKGESRTCQEHNQPFMPGQDECPACFQRRLTDEYHHAIEDLRRERSVEFAPVSAEGAQHPEPPLPPPAPETAPADGRRDTAPIISAISTVISLQQIGGQRHGMTTNLATRNPFGQPLRNLIGRDPTCNLPIPDDESVSTQHCSIGEDQDGNFYVADLDSMNGTFVLRDGREITVNAGREPIHDGNILRVGHTQFRIIITRPPERENEA